jgi:hypothetical protein
MLMTALRNLIIIARGPKFGYTSKLSSTRPLSYSSTPKRIWQNISFFQFISFKFNSNVQLVTLNHFSTNSHREQVKPLITSALAWRFEGGTYVRNSMMIHQSKGGRTATSSRSTACSPHLQISECQVERGQWVSYDPASRVNMHHFIGMRWSPGLVAAALSIRVLLSLYTNTTAQLLEPILCPVIRSHLDQPSGAIRRPRDYCTRNVIRCEIPTVVCP